MIALVQSKLGGNVSGTVAADTGGSGPQPITTSSVGFDAATTAGNLIVCVVWETIDTTGTPDFSGGLPVVSGVYSESFVGHPDTGGLWQFPLSPGLGASHLGFGAIWCIPNAPSLDPSNLISVTVNNEGSFSADINVEFALFEFSGVDASILDLGSSGSVSDYQVGGTPGLTFSSTAHTDLILTVLSAYPGGNLSAGSGYTLGPDAAVATVGQAQYILNAAPGQTASDFSGGSEPYWGIAALAFGQASGSPTVTVTSVSPSSGPTAGGTAVTITGTDFLSGASVDFGGSAATSVVVVSPTSITCVTPAHAAGAVTVSVTDSDGTGSLANGYTYTTTTPILDVSPLSLNFSATQGYPNPASQDIDVSNGNGGTLSWTVSSDESWLTASPTSGTNSGTVATSVDITGLSPGTYTGNLTFSASGADDSPQVVAITLSVGFPGSGGGGGGGGGQYMFWWYPLGPDGGVVGFAPRFSPVKKQPLGTWGLEAVRADSLTGAGQKRSILDRIDEVTPVTFPFVALEDMSAWELFEQWALAGNVFYYEPDLGWLDDEGFVAAKTLSLDWTPKFESSKIFSLQMKFQLIVVTLESVVPVSGSAAGGTAVSISGSNFFAPVVVSFGGVLANNIVVVSPNQITCITPAGLAGSVEVRVGDSGGSAQFPVDGVGSLVGGYAYV